MGKDYLQDVKVEAFGGDHRPQEPFDGRETNKWSTCSTTPRAPGRLSRVCDHSLGRNVEGATQTANSPSCPSSLVLYQGPLSQAVYGVFSSSQLRSVFPDNILDLLRLLHLDRVEVSESSIKLALTRPLRLSNRTNQHRDEFVPLANRETFRSKHSFCPLQPTHPLKEAHHARRRIRPTTTRCRPDRNEAIHGTDQTKLE